MSSAPTNEFPFIMTTTPNTKSFSFIISAAGKFIIDWGDGNIEKIDKNKTGEQTISHSYNNAGAHKIKLGGKATGYDGRYAVISFYENLNLAKIDGSLGQIFSTLSDGAQPGFGSLWDRRGTFKGCTNLTGSIPEKLFAGISGAPDCDMFNSTFVGCSNLTGSIPEKLFAGIEGAPADGMFDSTFLGCSGLSGNIPEKLFAGVSGAPAEYMFNRTFDGCSGLSGNIPEKLFAGVSGAPAKYMFSSTFDGCSNLTGSIPEKLFAGVSGAPAEDMFSHTFYGCSGLSGNIPEKLFAGISGAPASYMFHYTFYGCTGLSGNIPENLFAGIYGPPARSMFDCTFWNCSGLSGTMDWLGNIQNIKAPSAVTETKKESKPVVAPEFKPMPDMQTSNTLCVNISLSGNMIEKIPNLKSNIIGGVCSAYFAKNTNTDVQIKCDSVDANKFTVIISEKQNGKQR